MMGVFWPILCCVALTLVVAKFKSQRKRAQLPPGPPGNPLIGHLRSVPAAGQNTYFYELGLKYGDVVHLNILGQSLVILNSVQATIDLIEKRGGIYSGRPSFPIYDLWGMGDCLPFLDYGHEFRVQRRMIQNYFSKSQSQQHRPIQTREAYALAKRLIENPDDRSKIFLRFSTAIISEIGFGYHIESKDDPYVTIANDCSDAAIESGSPGATLIDLFPALRHFPSWFPGTYYATLARSSFPKFLKLREYPFERAKEQMAKGTATPCFLGSQLEQMHREGTQDDASTKRLQAAAAVVYIAGAETTSATLSFFTLAMVLYPECQSRAQKEIDVVIGSGRLPEFQDRESLPYLECLLQEVLRWRQVLPTGGVRKSLEEDVYRGMRIPKGATIIPNITGMTLDDSVYKDPFSFDPTRFLPSPAGRGEPYTDIFGWGRRICPGRYLAEDSVWIVMATILATISISKAIGADGKEITPDDVPIVQGITSHPRPYQCHLRPRSDAASMLLRQMVESA